MMSLSSHDCDVKTCLPSKSRRRRNRRCRTAILHSRQASSKLMEVISMSTSGPSNSIQMQPPSPQLQQVQQVGNVLKELQAPGSSGNPVHPFPSYEEHLQILDAKITLVMQALGCETTESCWPHRESSPKQVRYGVPADVLASQCKAVYRIQRAWRYFHRRHRASTFSCEPEVFTLSRNVLLSYRSAVPESHKPEYSFIVASNDNLERPQSLSVSSTSILDDMVSRCSKCKEKDEQCVCADLYCRRCVKVASKCTCDDPCVFRQRCPTCARINDDSLFDSASLLDTNLLKARLECGQQQTLDEWPATEEFLFLQNADECEKCGRVDRQELMRQCDGNCERIFHEECMNLWEGSACSHDFRVLICSECAGNGSLIQCPMCLLQDVSANEQDAVPDVLDADIRGKKMADLERHLNGILDLIDAADSGVVNLPKSARDLALRVAKETHSWLGTRPPTAQFDSNLQHVEQIMAAIMQKIKR